MLQNAYLLAKIGADTAENEQHFAEILPIGRRVADRRVAVSESVFVPQRGAKLRNPRPLRRGVTDSKLWLQLHRRKKSEQFTT